jgi:ApaG protein
VEIQTTNGITITVETKYLSQHSDPRGCRYVFGYQITIKNGNDYAVQLLRRHWFIQEACGNVREVEGEGVVGLQPILQPGAYHSYASFCDLKTDLGKMRGTFMMTRFDEDTFFDVPIPQFRLCMPAKLN